jgi:hypothetical protein
MRKSKQRRTRFVPRVVFEATFAGVVPVCVAATDCTSNGAGGQTPSADAGGSAASRMFPGVANECFGTLSCSPGPTCICLPPGESTGSSGGGSSSGLANGSSDSGVADSGLTVSEAGDAHHNAEGNAGDVAPESLVPPDASEAGDEQQGDSSADAADGDTG